jgi:glyoxylase-like metal-dependent hydrolase (beta-lactamase superfamily II)
MQEIAHGIYIENNYIGVTLGAINLTHGLLLVDAPPRPEDVRSWRASLLNLGGGVDRLLANMDAHPDRTLGVRALECTVVAQEKTAQVFRTRPTAFKSQDVETGAEWEQLAGLSSIRWAPPEITFSQRLIIHWGENPIVLEHHPGPYNGAIWVTVPEARVVFVGDAVIPDQPPFLANADLPAWETTLELLLSPAYLDYLVVGGRTGLVTPMDIQAQLDYLQRIHTSLEDFSDQKAVPDLVEELIPNLLKGIPLPVHRREQFTQRLRWGLGHYYSRHYRATANEESEE